MEEAEPLFRQGIEIGKATIGEGHPDYAKHLNNLAMLYEDMGRFDAAKPLYDQAVKIKLTDTERVAYALSLDMET